MRETAFFIAFGLATLAARSADAKHWRYLGAHPLSADAFCYIEAPHVHRVAPFKENLFRVYDDRYYFVGDPVPYGGEGPRHAYHGHHPIQVEVVVGHRGTEYCYLEGPHSHFFAPPPSARFEVRSGAYVYAGRLSGRYRRERVRYGYGPAITAEIRVPRPRPHLPVIVAPIPFVPAPHVDVHVRPHVTVRHVGVRHEPRARVRVHRKHRR